MTENFLWWSHTRASLLKEEVGTWDTHSNHRLSYIEYTFFYTWIKIRFPTSCKQEIEVLYFTTNAVKLSRSWLQLLKRARGIYNFWLLHLSGWLQPHHLVQGIRVSGICFRLFKAVTLSAMVAAWWHSLKISLKHPWLKAFNRVNTVK